MAGDILQDKWSDLDVTAMGAEIEGIIKSDLGPANDKKTAELVENAKTFLNGLKGQTYAQVKETAFGTELWKGQTGAAKGRAGLENAVRQHIDTKLAAAAATAPDPAAAATTAPDPAAAATTAPDPAATTTAVPDPAAAATPAAAAATPGATAAPAARPAGQPTNTATMFSASVNINYSRKWGFDMTASSKVIAKLVAIPAPDAFLEALNEARIGLSKQSNPDGNAGGS